ncbi:DLG [Oopsacas minuta]|uniref:DLG n=1 Tax=Oopsacas minuta TaxID=111878 RepID=A0A2P1GIU7_9METZ|nr:DLG [Oopsacas minuta]KAI6647031.1 DLG [Oopsacas minuta]
MASYKKEDAYRVLHLLEEYRNSLPVSEANDEVALRLALDNLIAAIRARLFTALSELLEFYNECLLDPSKASEEKSKYSSSLALHWQQGSLPPVSPLHKPIEASMGYYDFDIVINKGDSELGISLSAGIGQEQGVLISNIAPGSAADRFEDIRIGDRILEVNRVSFLTISQQTAVNTLNSITGDIELVLRRNLITREGERKITVVPLNKLNGSLGFTIKGGTDAQLISEHDGIFISKVFKKGAAEKTGQLSPGDRIISVNGNNIEHVTHDEAVRVLSSSGENILIKIEKGVFSLDNNDDTCSVHETTLERGEHGYGIKIIGRETPSLAVYVSQVTQGGPADISQKISKGDRILEVNGQDVRQVTHEVVASIFRSSQHHVHIKVRHAEEGWEQVMAANNGSSDPNAPLNILYQDTFFLRAWFHFDPSVEPDIPDAGLMFGQNSILCVVNSTNSDWWQACIVDDFGKFSPCGLIPSEKYQLKREHLKNRSVHFPDQESSDVDNTEVNKTKKKLFQKISKKVKRTKHSSKASSDSETVGTTPFYTHVEKHEIEVKRPVILLGPLKDHLNDMLVQEYSSAYAGCVLHTSRPRRENEEHGVDYYFVSSEIMEQYVADDSFIEAGHFNQNLYGTTARAVRDVLDAQRHCILSVSPQSIHRLEQAGLSPIVILLYPTSPSALLELPEYQHTHHIQHDDYEKQIELADNLTHDIGEQLTGIAKGDNIEELLYSVTNIINAHSYKIEWIPVRIELQ